jgi:hypothetical protein
MKRPGAVLFFAVLASSFYKPAGAADAGPPADRRPRDCRGQHLVDIPRKQGGVTPVWFVDGPVRAIAFEAGLSIDADGGRNAYRVDDKGLDTIKNACDSKRCFGLVTDRTGKPVRQPPPRQDYFVTPTSLQDSTKPKTDPDRYVDSESIPYIALPIKTLREAAKRQGIPFGLALGDFAMVVNRRNGKRAFAIYADNGPSRRIGEGSIALAEALGIPSSPRRGGAADRVQILVYPGSGNGKPRSAREIATEAERLVARWGDDARLEACRQPDRAVTATVDAPRPTRP